MNYFKIKKRQIIDQNLTAIDNKIKVSFEFFPPHTNKMELMIWQSINKLSKLNPSFISITSGTDSKKYIQTRDLVKNIKSLTTLNVAPHLTCINITLQELRTIAEDYWCSGIRYIVALRGDLPFGEKKVKMYGVDLVTLLKEIGDFDISVAAYPEVHPEAKSAKDDLINLKKKIEAGASRAITQFFFEVDSYLRFRDQCVAIGINTKIVPGILPVSNFKQLQRFASITNVHIPNWMNDIFNKLNNDIETSKIIGASIAMDMVNILNTEGVKDFHFYTMNRSDVTYAICHRLGI